MRHDKLVIADYPPFPQYYGYPKIHFTDVEDIPVLFKNTNVTRALMHNI